MKVVSSQAQDWPQPKIDLSPGGRPGLFSVSSSCGKEAFWRWGGWFQGLSLWQFKAKQLMLLFPHKYSQEQNAHQTPPYWQDLMLVRKMFSLCLVRQRKISVEMILWFADSNTGLLLRRTSTAANNNMRVVLCTSWIWSQESSQGLELRNIVL